MEEQEALLQEFCDLVDDDYSPNFDANEKRMTALAELIHDPSTGIGDLPSALWKILNAITEDTNNDRYFPGPLKAFLPKSTIFVTGANKDVHAWPVMATHIPNYSAASVICREAIEELSIEELQRISHLTSDIQPTETGVELIHSMLKFDVSIPMLNDFLKNYLSEYEDTNIVSAIAAIGYDFEEKAIDVLVKSGLDLHGKYELIGPLEDADWTYLKDHPLLLAAGKRMEKLHPKVPWGNLLTAAAEQNEMVMFQALIKSGLNHHAPSVLIDDGQYLSTKEYMEVMENIPSNRKLGIIHQQYIDMMNTMDASKAASHVLNELLPAQAPIQLKP